MLLGIDLGTSSAKALLLNVDGTVISEASSSYSVRSLSALPFGQSPRPGWAETNPVDWWSAVAIAVQNVVEKGYSLGEAASSAYRVQALALSGQMHGIVLVDVSGQPLYPAILWADTRSTPMLSAYYSLDVEMRKRLGNPIAAGMAGSTLLWLQEHEPTVYAEARWVLQPKDWLRLQLTGEVATEPSDASGTLLYDVVSDDWAWDAIEALKLRSDWLPTIVPSSAICASLGFAPLR